MHVHPEAQRHSIAADGTKIICGESIGRHDYLLLQREVYVLNDPVSREIRIAGVTCVNTGPPRVRVVARGGTPMPFPVPPFVQDKENARIAKFFDQACC